MAVREAATSRGSKLPNLNLATSSQSAESAHHSSVFAMELTTSDARLVDLRERLGRVMDLRAAANVLEWDQETYMPDGAAEARAAQIATVRSLAHEHFTTDEIGRLLEDLEPEVEELDPISTEAALVRIVRRDYDKARKLPTSLVARFAEAVSRAKQAWKRARAEDDFPHFEPHLRSLIDLNVEKAEALGYEEHIYDALLDEYEPGMKTALVKQIFDDLRQDLVPIVEEIAGRPQVDDRILHQNFDPDLQWNFGMEILKDFRYDFTRGRQDLSAHPFTTSFSISDVRITTRITPDFLPSALFGTMHEAGHALYEQGIDPELERTPLADGASLGIHESQSRLWENLVGRSRPFWQRYYPRLQSIFPKQLGAVPLDAFYRAINKVEPGFIRVEADEVTYNLHIMLRFELEMELIERRLDTSDLPAVWRQRMQEYLGIQPRNDADGVLQDIHWSLGAFGYFPTYALGNLMSTQIFEQAGRDLGDLDEAIAEGNFGELLAWLREHIHRYGRKLDALDLLERATGQGLSASSWLAYVRRKYDQIYPPGS